MKMVFALMVALSGSLWASGAGAQTRYHCRDSNGQTFVLSRPCPPDTRTTAAVAGPAPSSQSSYPSYSRSSSSTLSAPRDVPEHHQYMSSRCRSLDESIRSAYRRGTKPDVVEGMRREYRRDCSEQESEAYSQISSERRSRSKERREEEKSERLAAQMSKEQEDRYLQQCAESRRILNVKKARTDLSEGERNDLKRFEEAFIARCKR